MPGGMSEWVWRLMRQGCGELMMVVVEAEPSVWMKGCRAGQASPHRSPHLDRAKWALEQQPESLVYPALQTRRLAQSQHGRRSAIPWDPTAALRDTPPKQEKHLSNILSANPQSRQVCSQVCAEPGSPPTLSRVFRLN